MNFKSKFFSIVSVLFGLLLIFTIFGSKLLLIHHFIYIQVASIILIWLVLVLLFKSNLNLQKEIVVRKAIEKQLITHKEHLIKLAQYDHLTALPNRVFFNEILNKAINHAKRHQKKFAILLVDIDNFKKINDAIGFAKANHALKTISDRISKLLRSDDILARLGGDEFIILLNDIDHPKFAGPVAEKLLSACAMPVNVEDHDFYLTASIGICYYPQDGASLEDLELHADIAMYKAKNMGGNTYCYFTDDMFAEAQEYMHLESGLRKALQQNEFVLYFQPKLTLEDGLICGVEALIRWQNPTLGLINPIQFIPLAEETGLITQIGEWTLREACRINKQWQDEGYQPISVAVNISPKQFKQQDIVGLVKKVLMETEMSPEYLELEITETTMLDDIDSAIHRLNEIHKMGVKIAIDDFGTGYTSINYLKRFPLSVVKIDQGYVKGIPYDLNDNAITKAVIALAHSLNLKVVAEGVETLEQLEFLADLGCDIVQGYFLSRPLPQEKIILQLAKLEVM